MKVSEMNSSHLPEVARLSLQLGYPVSPMELEVRWQNLSRNPRHALLVCEEDSNIRGWMHLERVEDLIEEDKAEIKAIVVDEIARGNGVGKVLIREAEKWAKTNHLRIIYLSCNILRERTHAFYGRQGFTSNKTSLFFEKEI